MLEAVLPNEIWVAGKGPSLDTYDWTKAGPERIGINEAAFMVPNCTGAIAIDYPVLDRFKKELPKDVTVYRKSSIQGYEFPKQVLYNRDTHNLKNMHATATIGVQIFFFLGARIMHFVGFDAVGSPSKKYADSLVKIGCKGYNQDGYRKISKILLSELQRLGVQAIWEHLSL